MDIAYFIQIGSSTEDALTEILESQLVFWWFDLLQVAVVVLELTSQFERESVDVRVKVFLWVLLDAQVFFIFMEHSWVNFLLFMEHHERIKAAQDVLNLLLFLTQLEKQLSQYVLNCSFFFLPFIFFVSYFFFEILDLFFKSEDLLLFSF